MNTGLVFSAVLAAASLSADAASLRESFRSPQGVVRENTGPLFWMHGTETEVRLREYVGHVAESGQGILTIESRPHIDWMRAGWWRDVDIVLDECRKRGIKMMVFDDYWWPSQGMGGKYPIPEEYQGRDVKAGVYAKGTEPEKVENEICRVVATETAAGVFRLGKDGDKTIVYSWHVPERGSVQGLGHRQGRFPLVNGLDEDAVDWFIANYYQPYYDRYRDAFEDGTIPGFFFDEPETMSVWGTALEKELQARGDDMGELLTAFKFKLADPREQACARYRYLDARVEVWGRTMYGRLSDWCRRHGVFSSGHFMEHANDFYSLALSGGNVMQLMKHVTVPGVDLVCRQYYPHQRESGKHQVYFGQMPKYASSTAHVYNRHNGMNWCEIFGAYGQDLTYPQMKWLCDWHQYQGCYYLIPHSFNPKSPEDRDCPPYFFNGGYEPRYPLFRVWTDYNNRCALLLSNGEHVCRIAQCVPGISYHVGETIRPEMFAFAVQDAQLDSDWLMCDAVETSRIEKNPRTGRPALRTANGKEYYDILTLPATEYVPFAALEKALAFAKAGGVVVGYGIRPSNTPTRGKTAADAQKVVAEIFTQPAAFFLEGEPDGAALRAALAKPHPVDGRPLAVREFDFERLSSEDGRMLAVNHYEKDGRIVLFLANQDCQRRRDLAVRTKWSVEQVELWDAMQGTVEKPAVENGLVKVALEPSASAFLVWPSATAATSATLPKRVEIPEGTVVPLVVKETVTPMEAPDPRAEEEKVDTKPLEGSEWIWHPVNPKAQGKVKFRASLDLPKAVEARLVFTCDNAATVFVNGEQVAKQTSGDAPGYINWRRPTGAKVALKAGRNEIVADAENPIPGPAGFVAAFTWTDGAFRTDATHWEVQREGESFVKAGAVCAFGLGPWGKVIAPERVTRSTFKESVATQGTFTLPERKEGERVYFVCDGTEGEDAAAIMVNGAFAGGFIGAPHRLDVTQAVKTGANTLEIKPFRVKNPRMVVVR